MTREVLEGEDRASTDVSPSDPVAQDDLYGIELLPAERVAYDAIRDTLVDTHGYPEGPLLHQLCLMTLQQNRLQPNLRTGADEKRFASLSKDIASIADSLERQMAQRKEGRTSADIVNDYLARAKQFIKDRAGEHSIKCESCGTVVTTDGLPLWAIQYDPDDGTEAVRFKWSPEVIRLFNDEVIPMHLACYILRTSPKAIRYTQRMRGEHLRDFDEAEEEKQLAELLARDREEYEDAR